MVWCVKYIAVATHSIIFYTNAMLTTAIYKKSVTHPRTPPLL